MITDFRALFELCRCRSGTIRKKQEHSLDLSDIQELLSNCEFC